MNQKKVFIDCDTGTDDAVALMAALYAENAKVVAITTVAGNAALEHTYQNTLNLVRYLGFNVPVAKGATRPLRLHTDYRYAEETHGETGLGGVDIPKCREALPEKNAVTLLYEEACKAKGELEVIAIGPLTNIAIALMLYPELAVMIRHLWIMGGAARGGNVTASAEFNMWCDPEAAKAVLESNIPCTMIGLDVTEQAKLTETDIKRFETLGTKAGDVTAKLLKFMKNRSQQGGEEILMHDALAVAAALCPGCLEYEPCKAKIECDGAYTFGHTEIRYVQQDTSIATAVKVNVPVFREWLHQVYSCSAQDRDIDT